MKNTIILNRYPANYVEEELPEVLVEIRFAGSEINLEKANKLADEIEEFLNNK